jgi:hypothetical protein
MSKKVDPNAATPAELATVLRNCSGREITVEMIADDIEAGAPTNADGTIHLVHYMAWLLKVTARGNTDQP